MLKCINNFNFFICEKIFANCKQKLNISELINIAKIIKVSKIFNFLW